MWMFLRRCRKHSCKIEGTRNRPRAEMNMHRRLLCLDLNSPIHFQMSVRASHCPICLRDDVLQRKRVGVAPIHRDVSVHRTGFVNTCDGDHIQFRHARLETHQLLLQTSHHAPHLALPVFQPSSVRRQHRPNPE